MTLRVIATSPPCFLLLNGDYIALALLLLLLLLVHHLLLLLSAALVVWVDHVVLVLVAGVIRERDCIFRVRAGAPICCGASLRDRDSTGCVRIVVDRSLVAFSGLTLRHAVVLLSHNASISIHHSD